MPDEKNGAAFLDKRLLGLPRAVSPVDLRGDLERIYTQGVGRGDPTGWLTLDKLISIAPGQVTTITGYPNMGKSQFLDALVLNLIKHGWYFVLCSLENIPLHLHLEKLVKQICRQPLRDGPTPRMSMEEMHEAIDKLIDKIYFTLPAEVKPNPSLSDVMEMVEINFKERALWDTEEKKAVVIDPWNELEHFRPHGVSLTEYVGESLSRIRQWARRRMLHVFIVGHPSKQQRPRDTGELPVPMPDMISDSAHFWNKSDNCIAVHVGKKEQQHLVDIHVHKIRFSHIGRRGTVTLEYNHIDGTYIDRPDITWGVVLT